MPAQMLDKLRAVLRRDRRLHLQTGLTRAGAVLLSAMLAMMAVDWLATPHQGPWRWLMTISALACAAAALLLGCVIPLLRRRSLDSVAEQVDRAHPSPPGALPDRDRIRPVQGPSPIRGSERDHPQSCPTDRRHERNGGAGHRRFQSRSDARRKIFRGGGRRAGPFLPR